MSDIVDLRTIAISARCSDGARRPLILDDGIRLSIVALLARVFDGSVSATRINLTATKAIVVSPGVPMDDAAAAVSAFLAEIATGRPHEGRRNGIVLCLDGGHEAERYIYVYQTKTQIVVAEGWPR